jgi:phospholipid transport system substrate-binding protein
MAVALNRRQVLVHSALAATLLVGLPVVLPSAALADDALPPPASAIDTFYKVLIETMKQAKALGVKGRNEKLKPAVGATFDFPAMTQTAVGNVWSELPPDKQASLIDAFERMTTATYAHNFDGYTGERFEVDPHTRPRRDFQVVHSTLVRPNQEPVTFDYLMHQVDSTWKAVDIYYSGTVSQLAQRRSEFAAVLRSGGADGLLRRLNELTDQLLKE